MRDMDRREKAALDRWLTTEPEGDDWPEIDDDDVPVPETIDPAIYVERLLTGEERAQILLRLSLLNGGRTDGIHVADALSIMYDSDAMLSKVEPVVDEWNDTIPKEWTAAHTMTVYVLSMLDRPIGAEHVWRFLNRKLVVVEEERW